MANVSADLLDFFDQIWGDTEGYVYLPVKEGKGPAARVRKFFLAWPQKREAVVRHVVKYAAMDSCEIFFSPALYSRMQATNEAVLGSHVAWADFDGNFPEEWPTNVAPVPHIEVQSSTARKRHVYWKLAEFTGPKDVEKINRALSYALNADTSGWDANQFLRPPYSVNRKYREPITAKVVADRSEVSRYPRKAFAKIPTPAEAIREEISLSDLPQLDEVKTLARWDEDLTVLFGTTGEEARERSFDRSGGLARIAYKGAELEWTDEQIYVALEDADRRWGKYLGRATRDKILIELINRARAKVGYDVGSEKALLKSLLGQKGDEETADESDFFDIDQLNAVPGIKEWRIEGLLPKQGIGLFTGHAGTGKTQLAFQLAADLACGRDSFLQFPLTGKPLKVLFLSLEMGKYQLGHFTGPLREIYPDLALKKNLVVYAKGEAVAMNREDGQNLFVQMLEDYHPDVVIADSLSHMSSADVKDDMAMKALFEFLNLSRARYGFGMIIVHHHRKKANDAASRKQANDQNDIYGSFYITAALDFALDLEDRNDEFGDLDLKLLKARFMPKGEVTKVARDDKLHFTLSEVGGSGFDVVAELELGEGRKSIGL